MASTFGSRSGGLAGLTPGGRHLRELGTLGHDKLVDALDTPPHDIYNINYLWQISLETQTVFFS